MIDRRTLILGALAAPVVARIAAVEALAPFDPTKVIFVDRLYGVSLVAQMQASQAALNEAWRQMMDKAQKNALRYGVGFTRVGDGCMINVDPEDVWLTPPSPAS